MTIFSKLVFLTLFILFLFPCGVNFADELSPPGLLHDDAAILNKQEQTDISAAISAHNEKGPGIISILTISELPRDVSI